MYVLRYAQDVGGGGGGWSRQLRIFLEREVSLLGIVSSLFHSRVLDAHPCNADPAPRRRGYVCHFETVSRHRVAVS